jgi:hypothetical protein
MISLVSTSFDCAIANTIKPIETDFRKPLRVENDAVCQVGDKSTSQFSREYSWMFGASRFGEIERFRIASA